MFAIIRILFFSDTNLDNLVKKTNNRLELISRWFKLNKLSLNIKKIHFLFYNNHNKTNTTPTITIDGTKIDQGSNTKFFGVIINQYLTWDDHILAIKQQIAKSTGIIFRIRKICLIEFFDRYITCQFIHIMNIVILFVLSIERHAYTGYF